MPQALRARNQSLVPQAAIGPFADMAERTVVLMELDVSGDVLGFVAVHIDP